jgi:hypothetical protein
MHVLACVLYSSRCNFFCSFVIFLCCPVILVESKKKQLSFLVVITTEDVSWVLSGHISAVMVGYERYSWVFGLWLVPLLLDCLPLRTPRAEAAVGLLQVHSRQNRRLVVFELC